jgi:hypothetical protein
VLPLCCRAHNGVDDDKIRAITAQRDYPSNTIVVGGLDLLLYLGSGLGFDNEKFTKMLAKQ